MKPATQFWMITPTIVVLLWLVLLIPKGYSQSGSIPPRQGGQDFVYLLSGQDIRVYRVRRNGTLQIVPQEHWEIGQFPRFLAAAPNGHALYVGSDADRNNAHSGAIFEFTIRKNGTLSPLRDVEAGVYPLPLTVSPSGSCLYCSAMNGVTGQRVIYQYRIMPDGSLAALTPVRLNIGANYAGSLAVPPSGKYLYALIAGSPACFRISRSGTLSRLPFAPLRADASEMALDPSGRYAYLLQKTGTISVAGIDLKTGSLSSLRPVAHVSRGAYDMALNPRRQTLNVINPADGTASEFHIAPDGSLKPSAPPTFSAFLAFRRLGVDPRGQFVCITRSR